ncbi:MAG: helix-turn-helix domain-containing protein [Ruminiclostridium sp.]|nr:helix-turn-helix domain-containing protein [Ruminiclostridium sp.]
MEMTPTAERIKQRRRALGLSYQRLAERTGIARSTLQRYETGNIRNIPLDKLNVLAEGLETSARFILGMPEPSNAEPIGSEIYKVPVFDSVSAGFGAYADSRVMCYIPTYIEHSGEKEDFLWINVKGDSMAPTIDDGDRILVKRRDSVDSGSIAVVMIGDEAFVKRIKYGRGKGAVKSWVELHSINPYYPVRRFENEETNNVRVVGLVVEVSKKL